MGPSSQGLQKFNPISNQCQGARGGNETPAVHMWAPSHDKARRGHYGASIFGIFKDYPFFTFELGLMQLNGCTEARKP